MNTMNLTLESSKLLLRDQSLTLRRHLQQCRSASGPRLAASIWVERAHALIAPRFVSTVVVAVLALAVGTAWI